MCIKLLSRYFREELWGKIWGKACPRKLPWLLLGYTLKGIKKQKIKVFS